MRKTCLVVVLTCLAAGAGALAVPASSVATPGTDLFTCTFNGRTTGMTDIPGILASEQQFLGDAVDDALSAIPGNQAGETGIIVEGGTYAFGTTPPDLGVSNACYHIDVDGALGLDPTGPNTSGYPMSMGASGGYENVLCGTGTTAGNATITLTGNPEVSSITFSYTIAFAAGQGAAAALGGTMSGGGGTRSVAGAGVVHLDPIAASTAVVACADSDAAGFNASGAVTFVATS